MGGPNNAQQLSEAAESATAPFQCECTHGKDQAKWTRTSRSSLGIGAYGSDLSGSLLDGLLNVAGGGQALFFVRMFYGALSSHLWEDSSGITHTIPQGEGDQGDPLMHLLFSLGQFCSMASSFSRIWMRESRRCVPVMDENLCACSHIRPRRQDKGVECN